MNVGPVYSRFNITGRGVSVSILDDGIEKDHPDLMKNYVSERVCLVHMLCRLSRMKQSVFCLIASLSVFNLFHDSRVTCYT